MNPNGSATRIGWLSLTDEVAPRRRNIQYGGNTIVAGVRYPFEGYVKVDKQSFDLLKIPFNMENLSEVLLRTDFLNLGYIDPFETISSQDNPDGSHDL